MAEPGSDLQSLLSHRRRAARRQPQASERVDEISLFLELLLFEGQRADDLQRLYQSQPGEPPLATFGVRQLERSSGLLRRLAAATYAASGGTSDSDWLSYLAAGDLPPDGAPGPGSLERNLRHYRREKLEAGLDVDRLRQTLKDRFAQLETTFLVGLPFEHSEWPRQVRERYDRVSVDLRLLLSHEAGERMAKVREQPLSQLAERLQRGIDEELHDPRDPLPLGRVIDGLEALRKELDEPVPVVEPSDEKAVVATFDELTVLHRAYRAFRVDHVHVGGLAGWWLLFALVLSGALIQPLGRLLADVPQPPPEAVTWWGFAATFAVRLTDPLLLATLLFLGLWAFGLLIVQRRVALHFDHAERTYCDPHQGRFAGRLRAALRSGGPLRAPLENFLERIARDLVVHVRSEVRRELDRALDRLHRRRREIRWLHQQLLEFRKMHGGDETALPRGALSRGGRSRPGGVPAGTLDAISRQGSAVRHTMSQESDFKQLLERRPASLERFRASQAEHQPFARWSATYCDTFLDPLAFLDHLSQDTPDAFESELRAPGSGGEQRRRAAGDRTLPRRPRQLRSGVFLACPRRGPRAPELRHPALRVAAPR